MNKLYQWLVLAVAVAGIGTLLFSGNVFAADPVVGLPSSPPEKAVVLDPNPEDVRYVSMVREACGGTTACKGFHLRLKFLGNGKVTLDEYHGERFYATKGTGAFDSSNPDKPTIRIEQTSTDGTKAYETIYTFRAGMTGLASSWQKTATTATGDTNWGSSKNNEDGYQVELSTGWSSGSSSYQMVTEYEWLNGTQFIKSEKVTDNRSAKPIEKLQLFVRDAQGRPTRTINVWSYYSPTFGEYSNYFVEDYDYNKKVMKRYEGAPQAHGNFASLANQAKTNSQTLVVAAKTGYRQSIKDWKVVGRRGLSYTADGNKVNVKYVLINGARTEYTDSIEWFDVKDGRRVQIRKLAYIYNNNQETVGTSDHYTFDWGPGPEYMPVLSLTIDWKKGQGYTVSALHTTVAESQETRVITMTQYDLVFEGSTLLSEGQYNKWKNEWKKSVGGELTKAWAEKIVQGSTPKIVRTWTEKRDGVFWRKIIP